MSFKLKSFTYGLTTGVHVISVSFFLQYSIKSLLCNSPSCHVSLTCWLSRLYLRSRSPVVTPGAVREEEGGRGELAPARLRAYGGRTGPEVVLPVTVASPTLSPRGCENRFESVYQVGTCRLMHR